MPTKWSFEVPVAHLSDFEDLQDFHFTLSMLYSMPEYREYHTRPSKKELWLDNSFNEKMEADGAQELSKLAQDVGAKYVICPDDPKWQLEHIKREYTRMALNLSLEKLVVVVSSEEMREEMERLNAERFAISYWVRMNHLNYQPWYEGCHYLGLLNPTEVLRGEPPSCDTSMPIKLAMIGWDLDDWEQSGYRHIHTKDLGLHGGSFFDAVLSWHQVQLARSNIQQLKEDTSWI
jgi:hypothetical protein